MPEKNDRLSRAIPIAHVCQQANAAWSRVMTGSDVEPSWKDLSIDEKESIVAGVIFVMTEKPTPEELHNRWMDDKLREGWTYAKKKNRENKTSPLLVPFYKMPETEQLRDSLFISIVQALDPGI